MSKLWNPAPLEGSIGNILAIFSIVAVAITLATWRLRPQLLFSFVRHSPGFWALVMVLYPYFRFIPKELSSGAFFFERYRPLFSTPAPMVVASAAVFGFSHIIFRNPLSVALTFAAGLLFAWRYQATGSLFVSSVEHALYGCFVFTVGLGGLFYHGAGRAAIAR